jgi:hypothetical protein
VLIASSARADVKMKLSFGLSSLYRSWSVEESLLELGNFVVGLLELELEVFEPVEDRFDGFFIFGEVIDVYHFLKRGVV